jgi:oligopeptidase A (EC:3.4.24.70). Metallo peptidase. MEROPS family M03A
MDNPLLAPADPGELPDFELIRPAHAVPAVESVLRENREDLHRVLAGPASRAPNWHNLVEPLDAMSDRLMRAWGPVSHLFGVMSTKAWREAYNACLPKVTEYGLELSLNEALYACYEKLAASPAFAGFSAAQRKAVEDALRDFRLSGVALESAQKQRFKEVAMRLSALAARFEENLLDATQAWTLLLDDEGRLAGLTEQGLAAAAELAQTRGKQGYLITLDFPSYDAVMSYADDRALRRELYEAYATRASERGPRAGQFDNTALMDEILALRHEEARLLGFANYAELSLETKMAESPQAVEAFLLDLARRARPRAEAELEELRELARELHGLKDFAPWDLPYYSEKLRQRRLGFSDDELRPYFPLPQVLEGLFSLTQELFGVRIEEAPGVPRWQADVTSYRLRDASGREMGLFYLDPYARENKRGGAWMDECLDRRRLPAGLQRPVAYLTCNFAPPLRDQPALLTHDEVLTLFHEFGHGLQHLLTTVDVPAVAGIHGVAWDAVELPSQFMENWAYERATLDRFAADWLTGAKLPDDLFEKLRASRTFGSGMATLRQVELALFDLRLHRDYEPAFGAQVYDILAKVRSEVSVFPPPDWNRFPCSFSHIFAGGYAAGYYSYKWAEVLSADAFSAFVESGFDTEVGHRFRDTVLALGGSCEAMEVFRAFRGREPSIEPLLRQEGLVAEETASG